MSNENTQLDDRAVCEEIFEIADRIFTTRVDDAEILEFVAAIRTTPHPIAGSTGQAPNSGSYTCCGHSNINGFIVVGSGDIGDAEAERVINRLLSSDPEFDDCSDAAAFILRLVAERSAGQEPILWQSRTKPTWDENHPWTAWEECSAESAADFQKTPTLHDWQFEVRALYAAPTAPSLTTDAGAQFDKWWDRQQKNARDRSHHDDWLDLNEDDRSQYRAAFKAGFDIREYSGATIAAHPTEQPLKTPPDPSDIQGWAVTVNVNTVDILTIGHNSVSGIENIGDFAEVVRNCAKHLMGLIGEERTEQRMSDAARDVLAERVRQVNVEGWTLAHDDQHDDGELAAAAACYAVSYESQLLSYLWPWDLDWWKPTTPRRDLVKAGAMILAEIERLDRAARKAEIERSGGGE
ncbi:hypothetical protein [Paraburkholderia bannensis]|uniref:hypothetical protein n=1 Tax=Paraburkholderia bannensis TaxID=765414 RepID=UPI002AB6492A|nr:hypothetical protein [Paraburkholderia bannensis]